MTAFVPCALPSSLSRCTTPQLQKSIRFAPTPHNARSPTRVRMSAFDISMAPTDSASVMAEKLKEVYRADATKLTEAMKLLHFDHTPTRPHFPSVRVSDIAPVPDSEVAAFKEVHINDEYIKFYSEEGQKRARMCRELQFARWQWAVDNVDTYVNVLRVAGFADTNIQNMLDGTPLCFRSVDEYTELRRALRDLAEDIEAETGWANVNFVMTGSSVPGFSQNPCKGVADRPTRITSVSDSDVDISIIGQGVNEMLMGRHQRGEKEPFAEFDTTTARTSSSTRFGCRDLVPVCKASAEFWDIWDEKLDGGLQFTFGEYGSPTPPWETRIDIVNC